MEWQQLQKENNLYVTNCLLLRYIEWHHLRYAGLSDVGIFVSTPYKKYAFKAFEARYLEAEVINGRVMLVKYAYSDDEITMIRQVFTFDADGKIRLYKAGEVRN